MRLRTSPHSRRYGVTITGFAGYRLSGRSALCHERLLATVQCMNHMHVHMSLQISLSDTSLDSCCYHWHPFVTVLWVPSSQDGGSQGTQDMAALVFVRAPCVQDKGMDGSKSHMAYQ